jgi:hypothetical protein
VKKFLLSTALAFAFAAPAHASFTQFEGVEDGDEQSFFIYDADNTQDSFLSGTGNGAGKSQSMSIHTNVDSHFSNGNSTIKPDSGALTSVLFTALPGFSIDGFFVHTQLGFDGDGKAPKTGTFYMTVNGTETFTYTGLKFNADIGPNGFDEPGDATTETLVTSVLLWTAAGTYFDFKEAKQFDFSPCSVGGSCFNVINPTSGVPEPSTWLLGLTGFGLVAALGWKRKRSARYAAI